MLRRRLIMLLRRPLRRWLARLRLILTLVQSLSLAQRPLRWIARRLLQRLQPPPLRLAPLKSALATMCQLLPLLKRPCPISSRLLKRYLVSPRRPKIARLSIRLELEDTLCLLRMPSIPFPTPHHARHSPPALLTFKIMSSRPPLQTTRALHLVPST